MLKQNLFNKIDKMTNTIKLINEDLDLFLPGGGYQGFIGISMVQYIACLVKKNKLLIKKIYCTSAGTIVGILYILFTNYNINIDDILNIISNNFYLLNKSKRTKKLKLFVELLFEIIPLDFYLLCNNKIFITISQLNKNIINVKSNFISNNDLKKITLTSCTIPFLFSKKFVKIDNIYSFDGFYPRNISNKLNCLVLNLIDSPNLFNYLNFPSIEKINYMIIKGWNSYLIYL